jgi:peptidoglycan/LPS O-acetylase OafA/YrhL
MEEMKRYLPTLDGWRALAILMVILFHDGPHSMGRVGTGWFQENGLRGVDIFFSISGLLICSRLLAEEAEQGKIGLQGFYIRRAFRILPPAFCYLAVLGILGLAGVLPLIPKEWFAALFFYRNYSRLSTIPGHMDWYSGHFWSLAVEEHFYLILPSILVFVPRSWRIAVLGGMVAVVAAWRIYRQQKLAWIFLLQHTEMRLDALLVPAIIAILLTQPRSRSILLAVARFWLVPSAVLIYLVSSGQFPVITPMAESFMLPIVLLGTVAYPDGLFARFLETLPLRWVGRISYSLYLWQQMFFNEHFYSWFKPLGFVQAFPMRWLMLFGCAAASYYLVERPSIRMGHRLAALVWGGQTRELRALDLSTSKGPNPD